MTAPRIVLDASAALRVVLASPGIEEALAALERASLVLAPSLFASETANALWKLGSKGLLPAEVLAERWEMAMALPSRLCPDHELAVEALSEASRHGHPVYDLLYAVLARREGCRVLTFDRRLLSLLRKLGIGVIGGASAGA
ncbi:MAG TPA: type II toxin-antitoxin system VapC family toxin [Thermoanaerobaculia bacterium]|nr:type II toxin-antitoxin system VapC family toxin [Thermoanaerobaculia bacterium]HQN05960.1 type II toxin-antitoxin system VapC family toxin [Thermoanaerobaculia bacterium]HQP85496.1 type II toxin-antitoxin system VapC family toxin [Thermoanaerobaculia bacterium]